MNRVPVLIRWVVLLPLAGVLSCTSSHDAGISMPAAKTNSEIVKKVEAAGAGGLSNVSPNALEHWFTQHKNVAIDTARACIPVRKNAAATRGDSLEAKVCNAAVGPAIFAPITVQGTGKKY